MTRILFIAALIAFYASSMTLAAMYAKAEANERVDYGR